MTKMSIPQLNMNDSETLAKFKESVNNVIDRKMEEIALNESIKEISNLPLMTCRNLFMKALPHLYESSEGQSLIKRYFKVLRENKQLAATYMILESMRNSGGRMKNPQLCLTNYIRLAEGMDKTALAKSSEEYRKIVVEAISLVQPDIDAIKNEIEREKALNESMDYVFFNKQTVANTPTYTEHMTVILENAERNNAEMEKIHKATLISSNKDEIRENVKKLEEMANDTSLSQWEREAVGAVIEARLADKCPDLFESCKNECIAIINEAIENEEENVNVKTKMGTIKEQLEKKKYSDETFVTDILKLKDLKNTIAK